jgi:hypothetical protein
MLLMAEFSRHNHIIYFPVISAEDMHMILRVLLLSVVVVVSSLQNISDGLPGKGDRNFILWIMEGLSRLKLDLV